MDYKDFDLGAMTVTSSGMDDFLAGEADYAGAFSEFESAISGEVDRIRIASVEDLKGFERVASTDTLIRRSEQDFWRLAQDENGEYFIERLFDEEGNPLTM